jgi:hypothetical protein
MLMNASFQFFRLLVHTSFHMRNLNLYLVEYLQDLIHILDSTILRNFVKLCLKFHLLILESLDFLPVSFLTFIELVGSYGPLSFELLNFVLELLVLIFKIVGDFCGLNCKLTIVLADIL